MTQAQLTQALARMTWVCQSCRKSFCLRLRLLARGVEDWRVGDWSVGLHVWQRRWVRSLCLQVKRWELVIVIVHHIHAGWVRVGTHGEMGLYVLESCICTAS